MAFWHELKKRKVLRDAGAYVIVAWLLVQVADIFFPALNLPPWSVTLAAGLVIIGFPIALLLAWAYEIILARLAGFSLHAATVCEAHQHSRLERLCRYITCHQAPQRR